MKPNRLNNLNKLLTLITLILSMIVTTIQGQTSISENEKETVKI